MAALRKLELPQAPLQSPRRTTFLSESRVAELLGNLAPELTPQQIAERAEATRRRDQQRAERRAAERRAAFAQIVGPRYANCTVDGFEIYHEHQEVAVSKLRSFVAELPEHTERGSGLVLAGPVGTGKDHLMCAALRSAFIDHGMTVKRISGPELFGRIRAAIGDGKESRLVDEMTAPTILAISDPCPSGTDLTAFNLQVLYRIVDERYTRQTTTWASMNIATKEQANATISEPVFSRLMDDAATIQCIWPSYRDRRRVKFDEAETAAAVPTGKRHKAASYRSN